MAVAARLHNDRSLGDARFDQSPRKPDSRRTAPHVGSKSRIQISIFVLLRLRFRWGVRTTNLLAALIDSATCDGREDLQH